MVKGIPNEEVDKVYLTQEEIASAKEAVCDNETLKKETSKYLEFFRDHPYIFNLGHGILPETNPEMVENLIKIVKNFK